MVDFSRAQGKFTCFGRSLQECLTQISQSAFLFLIILPLAGLMQAAGDGLQRAGLSEALVLSRTAESIIEFTPLFLAVCLAWILTGGREITAAFSGGLAWLIWQQSAEQAVRIIFPSTKLIYQSNIFSALLAGFLAALTYKLLHKCKLPAWLGFFAGKNLVPVAVMPLALILGGLSGYVWHLLAEVLSDLAIWVTKEGPAGVFVYGTLNRWLLPFGLHEIMDNEIWYNLGHYTSLSGELVSGEASRFLAGDVTAGRILAGFFPANMFVIPATSACLLFTVRKGERLIWGGCLALVALLSMISGVTAPYAFILLFISPPVFLLYGLLSGLSMLLSWYLDIYHGFLFAAGLADYLVYWHRAARPGLLLVVGAVMASLSFALTYISIRWLHFPGADLSRALPDGVGASALHKLEIEGNGKNDKT